MQEPVKELSFMDYLEVVVRRKKMIFLTTGAAFVLSVAVALVLPKVYQSTARILPPQPDQGLMGMMMGQMGEMGGGGLASLAGSVLGSGTLADQYASIMESEAIMDPIIDQFGLMKEYKTKYRLDMYKKMDKIVDVKAGRKDGIISVSVEDEDPKKAADIANAYIDELGKLVAQMSMNEASLNRRFLEGRLARARADLARAEEAMKAFQSKNKVISVTEQAKVTIEGVAQLRAQLVLQQTQLSALRSQYTDSAQEVKAMKASIADLESHIARLEGRGTGAIPSFGSVPGLGYEEIRLLREFKTQEMLVELLTKQNELAKLSESKNVNTVQVIQRARPADKKVKPKRARMVILATFFGFALSVGSAVARFQFDYIPLDTRLQIRKLMMTLSPRVTSIMWKEEPSDERPTSAE